MLRAVLLGELTDASDAAVHRTLEADPETAKAPGFDPADVPDQSTLSRARTNRFAKLDRTIKVNGQQIRTVAARRGGPIGVPSPDADSASTKSTDSSKRTVNRLIRGKPREVLDELTTVVFPAIEFDRLADPIYDDHELLMLETLLGVTGIAANGGAMTYGDHVNPEPTADDPFSRIGRLVKRYWKRLKTSASRRSRRWSIGARPAS